MDKRSRLVGREFKVGTGNGIYAAAHPFEALRTILSVAATRDGTRGRHG